MLVQKATLTPVVLLLIVWVAAPDIGDICSPDPLSCCQGGRPLLIVLSRSQCFYLAPAVGSAAPDGVFSGMPLTLLLSYSCCQVGLSCCQRQRVGQLILLLLLMLSRSCLLLLGRTATSAPAILLTLLSTPSVRGALLL